MAVIMATFTNSGDAGRAADALRSSGFAGVAVGTSAGDVGDIVGSGMNKHSLYNTIVIGSALAGAVALGAVGFLLGMFSMDTPDVRGMGTVASIGPALSALAMFTLGLAAFGGISGLLGGLVAAGPLTKSVCKLVEDGDAPRRPMVSVTVGNRREEDVAHEVLRIVGPPFEVIVR